ncbi:TPA: thioester-forming surface-anchored protein [Streptococcus equi subsp. zooepidemicus]|nr:thioester-forming surface-anchored protein [Streptococcus equi subsp. zooepidemicus]HEL0467097.1 thioester-forming surface-anchored protein [Streptococcus equi subsp. zooepidemicus]HEL0482951.1 thioester-forming surface-anchored protein [Streptococcus equi subsp. zooepidemicus]HEL0486914.1 thioester-forming surface-anchored protein [Streptococcus equi subsp. zooepidemicus]HEL0490992.1 thioester-forming surface-anchored protein [Streptococcus equi subsp. zooepidemicus]
MRKTMKKMLAASTLCIIMSGSFISGSARVLAEQYYGYDDGTQPGREWPAYLYVTPVNTPERKIDAKHCVYCFNRTYIYPDPWEQSSYNRLPNTAAFTLPVYDRKSGNNELLKKYSSKQADGLELILGNILANGYPYKKLGNLDERRSRRLTQLAIWHFTDGYSETDLKKNFGLNQEEEEQLKKLILDSNKSPKTYSINLYITQSKDSRGKPYQHLINSTGTIHETPEKSNCQCYKIALKEDKQGFNKGYWIITYIDQDSDDKYDSTKDKLVDKVFIKHGLDGPRGENHTPTPDPMPQPEPQPMPNPAPKPMDPKPESKPEPKPTPQPEVKPQPETKPQKPNKPSAMASQPSGKALPKTNDTSGLMTVLGTSLLSLLGLGFLTRRKRK